MEENKYICPQCGTEMGYTYEKPALNLLCPKCGCKIATTKWEEIDLDDTLYTINVGKRVNPQIDQIKTVSKLCGLNFIQSKELLLHGGIVKKCKAVDASKIIKLLKELDIEYKIDPTFPWSI